jgi:phage virion morphogenesis protein
MSATLEIDIQPVEFMLNELIKKMQDVTPVMSEIGEIIVTQTQDAFDDSKAPDGSAWKPSLRGGQTLVNTARLRRSINYQTGKNSVEVGTNVVYAAIHQFGGKTKAHVIRPKKGKALMWPGAAHPVKSVNHPGSDIPARPFLPDEHSLDFDEISDTLTRYLLS